MLLAGTGLRIGEALGLRMDKHRSARAKMDPCSALPRQTVCPRNILRDSLPPVLEKLKKPKTGFHCFRRFRESVLHKSDAHALSVDYWMGHENCDRGTRYAKQLIEDVAWGRLWTRKIGLGSEFLANFSDSENRPTKAALVAYSNWD